MSALPADTRQLKWKIRKTCSRLLVQHITFSTTSNNTTDKNRMNASCSCGIARYLVAFRDSQTAAQTSARFLFQTSTNLHHSCGKRGQRCYVPVPGPRIPFPLVVLLLRVMVAVVGAVVVQVVRVRVAVPLPDFLRAVSGEHVSPATRIGILRASQHEPP